MVTPLKSIGLLGGSFNPAHEGHLYISQIARETLGLDEIWWLVAPKNPLKKEASLAPYEERLEGAGKLAEGHDIRVLDFEHKKELFYTVETLGALKKTYPGMVFVWLMGADCFQDLHTWKSWRRIMEGIPLAVFPRPGFTKAALGGPAATAYAKNRLPEDRAEKLAVTKPPAWVYINCRPFDISATRIRKRLKGRD